MTLYNLDMFMEGRVDQMLDALLTSDMQERLAEAGLKWIAAYFYETPP